MLNSAGTGNFYNAPSVHFACDICDYNVSLFYHHHHYYYGRVVWYKIINNSCFVVVRDLSPFLKTNDYCAIPQQLKDQLGERYPEARRAYLKTGGDFPFLSRPDEVNLHLQVYVVSDFSYITWDLLTVLGSLVYVLTCLYHHGSYTSGGLAWKLGQIWFTTYLKVILEEVLAKRVTKMTLTSPTKMIEGAQGIHLLNTRTILAQKAQEPVI